MKVAPLLLWLLERRKTEKNTNKLYTIKKKVSVTKFIKTRETKGEHAVLFHDLRCLDPDKFYQYYRMTPHNFDVLLNKVCSSSYLKLVFVRNA